jgi:DNA ligase (NAD+)
VKEIGPKIAASIRNYFEDPENCEIINRLRTYGLQFSGARSERKRGGTLDGKTIVISGVFSKYSRDELKDMIEENGGKNSSSISGSTSFILAGENMGPAKKEKAASLGVPLMSESEFLILIGKV